MTATAHALIGGAIAASVQDPALGLTLSFISHPIADIIPHYDFGWGWRDKTKLKLFLQGSFDLGFGVLVSYFLFGQFTSFWYFTGCIFLAEFLDLATVPYWLLNWRFIPFSWIYKFQHNIQGKAKLPWGFLTQVTTVVLLVIVLNYVTH